MGDPQPVSELDQEARSALKLSIRFIYTLMISLSVIVVALLAVVGLLVSNALGEHARTETQINQAVSKIDQAIFSQCAFDYPVAVAPIPLKTGKLGVQLVEGARVAVYGLRCPQDIGSPSPNLRKLGKKYGIKIR